MSSSWLFEDCDDNVQTTLLPTSSNQASEPSTSDSEPPTREPEPSTSQTTGEAAPEQSDYVDDNELERIIGRLCLEHQDSMIHNPSNYVSDELDLAEILSLIEAGHDQDVPAAYRPPNDQQIEASDVAGPSGLSATTNAEVQISSEQSGSDLPVLVPDEQPGTLEQNDDGSQQIEDSPQQINDDLQPANDHPTEMNQNLSNDSPPISQATDSIIDGMGLKELALDDDKFDELLEWLKLECQDSLRDNPDNYMHDNADLSMINDLFNELNGDCPICFETIASYNLVGFKTCIHTFHFDCIKSSLTYSGNYECPYCRQRYTPEDMTGEDIDERRRQLSHIPVQNLD